MRYEILGSLEVRRDDGEPLALGGVKPRAVLAVLLLHANSPVSAERLALALWGEDAPDGAVKTAQVHVWRLRKALGDADVIATTPAGYSVRVGAGELDAAQFERLVADGRAALAQGRAQQAAALLREALALWRGPALADLAFEPFAGAEIARLEEQRLAALEARIDADLAAGRHDEIVPELRRLVAMHPSRDRLAAQLMLALYRCGRQTDALDAYANARRVLLGELGLEPGPQLRELQQAILRQDAALGTGGTGAAGGAGTAPPAAVASVTDLQARFEAERAAQPFVLFCGQDGRQQVVALPAGDGIEVTIGRDAGNAIALPWDRQVSRVHAVLQRVGSAWAVSDDGLSRNGTLVNGEPLAGRRRLADHDIVRCGSVQIEFRDPAVSPGEDTQRAPGEDAAP